jgi:hypothetical protein
MFYFYPGFKKQFKITTSSVVEDALKMFFAGDGFFGEIDFTSYPFVDSNPQIKLHQFLSKSSNPQLDDQSSAVQLLDVQPIFVDNLWTDRLFLFILNGAGNKSFLRVDSVSASNLQGSAQNMALINTQGYQATFDANFAQIGTPTEEDQIHTLATCAYQSEPENQNIISVAQAKYQDE